MSEEDQARIITTAIDDLRDELVAISLEIHSHPELNYEEYHASKILGDLLENKGFAVVRGIGGVDTAFRAVMEGGGGPGPTIGILSEYDALPGIGHGCGHNLLAISTVGAGLGLVKLMDSLPGNLVILGTPAEEGGGGKVRLLNEGIFDDIDVALSSHPSTNVGVISTEIPVEESWSLAMIGYRYAYYGKASHAAAAPHEGINALNAVIHLFTGIDALRQHLRQDARIHGIITHGGTAPNVTPEFAAANFMIRSRDRDYLTELVDKVKQVAEGAALITGARLEISAAHPLYENVRPNAPLADICFANANVAGMRFNESSSAQYGGGASTDFGNVSQVKPSFALRFPVSERAVPGHSLAMAEVAKTQLAHDGAIAAAKVLALSARDILLSRDLLEAAKADFEARGTMSKSVSDT